MLRVMERMILGSCTRHQCNDALSSPRHNYEAKRSATCVHATRCAKVGRHCLGYDSVHQLSGRSRSPCRDLNVAQRAIFALTVSRTYPPPGSLPTRGEKNVRTSPAWTFSPAPMHLPCFVRNVSWPLSQWRHQKVPQAVAPSEMHSLASFVHH